MGKGETPVPAGQQRSTIDAGTLARTASPPPGPVGLASGTAPANAVTTAKPSMADQILGYARRRSGQRVGNGECFTLVDEALRGAGAQSASNFGRITPNADYTWGQTVTFAELQPGDVIQFRNYRFDRQVVTKTVTPTQTRTSTSTDFQTRPHHTAIVESVDGDGAVTVIEQNVPHGRPVQRTQLFFADSTTQSGGTTTTIQVSGTFWFFRPQAR
jgi:hypothetical protein